MNSKIPSHPHAAPWATIVSSSYKPDDLKCDEEPSPPYKTEDDAPPSYLEVMNTSSIAKHLVMGQQIVQFYSWTNEVLIRTQLPRHSPGALNFEKLNIEFRNPKSNTTLSITSQTDPHNSKPNTLAYRVEMTFKTSMPCNVSAFCRFFNEKSERAYAICKQGMITHITEPMARDILNTT